MIGIILAVFAAATYALSAVLTRKGLNESDVISAALVLTAIGGDDTLTVAYKMYQLGLKCVAVPKKIDNDLWGTDYTFGFKLVFLMYLMNSQVSSDRFSHGTSLEG